MPTLREWHARVRYTRRAFGHCELPWGDRRAGVSKLVALEALHPGLLVQVCGRGNGLCAYVEWHGPGEVPEEVKRAAQAAGCTVPTTERGRRP